MLLYTVGCSREQIVAAKGSVRIWTDQKSQDSINCERIQGENPNGSHSKHPVYIHQSLLSILGYKIVRNQRVKQLHGQIENYNIRTIAAIYKPMLSLYIQFYIMQQITCLVAYIISIYEDSEGFGLIALPSADLKFVWLSPTFAYEFWLYTV